MPDSSHEPPFDASSPTADSASGDDPPGVPLGDPLDRASRRSSVALMLAFLGVPTFGITAIAGFGLGLAGLGERPRGRAVAAVVVSLLVVVGWLGGLAGALEAMRVGLQTPNHILNAERVLAGELVARILPGVDQADPRPPSRQSLIAALDTIPERFRRYGDPPVPLAVEPAREPPGTIVRWWISAPVDPTLGSAITEVIREPGRTRIFLFAADGREVWSFNRAFDPTKTTWDDRDAGILAATRPAAEAIAEAAMERGGVLPDALEAARIIESSGPGPHPSYRPRPGGLFDLVVPGGRDHATFAAFGGVLVPIRPND